MKLFPKQDALLEHLATHHSVPSIDNYRELLPKRSCFEFDLAMLSKFSDTPSLLPVRTRLLLYYSES